MKLPGWFRTNSDDVVTFNLDGRTWVSDGKVAIAGDAPSGARDLGDSAGKSVACHLKASETVTDVVRKNGFAVLNGVTFAAHFIDLVEREHPGVTWRLTSDRMTASAFAGDVAVAFVMMTRSNPDEDDGRPKCVTCDGSGEEDCRHCDGEGEDGDTLDDCDACEGTGKSGLYCTACGGDGLWKEPAAVAAE